MTPSSYRIAVLSDIHGNLPAFEAVMSDLARQPQPDTVLVAGDVTSGPGQTEILRRLIAAQAVVILGNGEVDIKRLAAGTAPDYISTANQFTLTRWALAQLGPTELAYLQSLPEQRRMAFDGAGSICIMHGSPRHVSELVYPSTPPRADYVNHFILLDEVIDLVSDDVLVFGHTHLAFQVRRGRRLALNPGAVSFPANGYIGAQYAVLTWDGLNWQVALHNIPYDLERVRRDYHDSGFLEVSPLARVYLQSIFRGIDYLPPFFSHARRLAQEAGCAHLPYFPDEVWQQAGRTFLWDSDLF